MNLWHALRRECTGALRSVRYDLATHRAGKVAGAYTEEFQPGPPVPTPSRLVPLTGVTLLLVGGAAGAFLAISGGVAALGGPEAPPRAQQYAAAASMSQSGADNPRSDATPVTPRRAAGGARPSPTPTPGASTPPAPAPPPVIEGTSPVPSASVSPSAGSSAPSTSASPSAAQSSAGSTEGPRSRGHRGRR